MCLMRVMKGTRDYKNERKKRLKRLNNCLQIDDIFLLIIYLLAVLGLSCSMWDLVP